jgi:hypothetical protein
MKIQFNHKTSIQDSMVFENIFEPELQLDEEEKTELLANCEKVYLFIDDKIAGEIYAIGIDQLIEDDPDLFENEPLLKNYLSEKAVYVHSCALLPEYIGKGLGLLINVYFHGYLKGIGYEIVISHATADSMEKIYQKFGGELIVVRENWYDTDRTAKLYEIKL